jgi:putative ABC transport system substrate-binding protein
MERSPGSLSRRRFVVGAGAAGLGLLAGCVRLPWQAEPPVKVYRIGWLNGPPPPTPTLGGNPNLVAFREGLRDLGYIEGQNAVIEIRTPRDGERPLADLAAELVHQSVDVIVAAGGPATVQAAREATATIPIVMVAAGSDPIGQGFITSYARPGGNITGLTLLWRDSVWYS